MKGSPVLRNRTACCANLLMAQITYYPSSPLHGFTSDLPFQKLFLEGRWASCHIHVYFPSLGGGQTGRWTDGQAELDSFPGPFVSPWNPEDSFAPERNEVLMAGLQDP